MKDHTSWCTRPCSDGFEALCLISRENTRLPVSHCLLGRNTRLVLNRLALTINELPCLEKLVLKLDLGLESLILALQGLYPPIRTGRPVQHIENPRALWR